MIGAQFRVLFSTNMQIFSFPEFWCFAMRLSCCEIWLSHRQ